MKPLLNRLLIFILLYLLVDVFVKSHTMGITTGTIQTTLFGNADEFLDPMNKSVFLEFVHMQIFFLMMLVLTLSAVYIRLLHHKTNTILSMNLFVFFALLTPITLTAAYFYSAQFTTIYLVAFFAWHIIALWMTLRSLWELNLVT
ncbi:MULTISPECIES: hypothetical protein [Sulfurimonas]|uniref:hypothetical protein n=1 Tax=Sulfurimonas TaxID=202746 RepID=UPI001FE41DD0|nr:hypothetical protein [Sulfurimonas indica]